MSYVRLKCRNILSIEPKTLILMSPWFGVVWSNWRAVLILYVFMCVCVRFCGSRWSKFEINIDRTFTHATIINKLKKPQQKKNAKMEPLFWRSVPKINQKKFNSFNSIWNALGFFVAHHFYTMKLVSLLVLPMWWKNIELRRTKQSRIRNHFRYIWFILVGCIVHILLQFFVHNWINSLSLNSIYNNQKMNNELKNNID